MTAPEFATGETVAEFERTWRAAGSTTVEKFLDRVDTAAGMDSDVGGLLRSLVAAEVRLRTAAGDAPSRDEYLTRFPDHAAEVESVFEAASSATVEVPRRTGDTTSFNRHGDETNLGSGTAPEANAVAASLDVQRIGDYELLEVLGRGGMGIVFKARQRSLDRLVALKMILAGELAGREEINRFRTEAHAAARLDHPGIVPVYEVGEENGRHYFSMAYVEGESLQDRIERGAVDLADVSELMRRLAEAVDYAHSRGVVHRDLKPHNVLVDASGRPRITDFGLAKRIDTDDDLTQSGTILGTAAYMSPEQARGDRSLIGPRSDVYSLGAILYCLLTGRPPFKGRSLLDTLQQVTTARPEPPTKIAANVPSTLETVCLTCLEKNPDDRYQSAADFAAALGGTTTATEPVAASARLNSRRWIGSAVVGSVAAVLAVALVGFAINAAMKPVPPDDDETVIAGDSGAASGGDSVASSDANPNSTTVDPAADPAIDIGPTLHYLGLGVNNYPWYELRFAQEDVLRLKETFESHATEDRAVETEIHGDPTRQEIIAGLETLAKSVDEDDIGLVAFSGIEIVADGRFYLLPSDVRAPGRSDAGGLDAVRESEERTLVRESAVSAADIADALGASRGRIVIFVDSCRAEMLGRDLAAINPLLVTFASCRADEVSLETPKFGKNGGGAFTSALVEALEGAADVNGDRRVSLREAVEFTIERTRETTRALSNEQRPIVVGNVFDVDLTERK